jgi:hypothetical protein
MNEFTEGSPGFMVQCHAFHAPGFMRGLGVLKGSAFGGAARDGGTGDK